MHQNTERAQQENNQEKAPEMNNNIIRLAEVVKLVGLSKSSIWLKLNMDSPYYDETFPKQFRLSKRAVAWDREEIMEWIKQQKDKR